jgi:hypothetical protein
MKVHLDGDDCPALLFKLVLQQVTNTIGKREQLGSVILYGLEIQEAIEGKFDHAFHDMATMWIFVFTELAMKHSS